jgi:hypothetical protein
VRARASKKGVGVGWQESGLSSLLRAAEFLPTPRLVHSCCRYRRLSKEMCHYRRSQRLPAITMCADALASVCIFQLPITHSECKNTST